MGGSGSTRWQFHRKKTVVEDCLVLDIGALLEGIIPASVFRSGRDWESLISWRSSRTHEVVARVSYTLSWLDETPEMNLEYDVTSFNGERQYLSYSISLESTPCTFGGERWWFSCPQCGRRVVKLYKPPLRPTFACRRCHDLTYTSTQQAHKFDRLGAGVAGLRRYLRLERKLQECQRWRKRAYKLLEGMEAIHIEGVSPSRMSEPHG